MDADDDLRSEATTRLDWVTGEPLRKASPPAEPVSAPAAEVPAAPAAEVPTAPVAEVPAAPAAEVSAAPANPGPEHEAPAEEPEVSAQVSNCGACFAEVFTGKTAH